MVIDQTWISLVSASTALIASVAGPIVTLRVGRQQFRANVLSVNRQRWIENFRDGIASLVSQLHAASNLRAAMSPLPLATFANDASLLRRVEELTRTTTKIELMLNPHEADHQRLHALMEQTLGWLRADPSPPDLIEKTEAAAIEITRTTQGILKREWTRVKRGN